MEEKTNKKLKTWHTVVIVILAIAIIYGISNSNKEKPTLAGVSSTPNNNSSQASSSNKPQYFTVGQTAQYQNIKISLNSVKDVTSESKYTKPKSGNIFIHAEFTIENNSQEDFHANSFLFDMYVDDLKTDPAYFSTVNSPDDLSGTIAVGKKLTGVLSLEIPSNYKNIEFHYKNSFFDNQKIVFKYSK